MRDKYLITTDGWFYAPDGKQYHAVWGEAKIVEDIFLGIKTNRNSTNWYAVVGNEDKQVIVAGCQIHYAIKCEEPPKDEMIKDYQVDAITGFKEVNRPTHIWIAE